MRPEDIKEDLARGGQIVRRKAREAGQAIADATADARITTAIKGKLLANRDLSALSISVNTTGGVVTLRSLLIAAFAPGPRRTSSLWIALRIHEAAPCHS